MTNIYLQNTNSLASNIKQLNIDDTFILSSEHDRGTQITSTLAKINKELNKKGEPIKRLAQKKYYIFDATNRKVEVVYKVRRIA